MLGGWEAEEWQAGVEGLLGSEDCETNALNQCDPDSQFPFSNARVVAELLRLDGREVNMATCDSGCLAWPVLGTA